MHRKRFTFTVLYVILVIGKDYQKRVIGISLLPDFNIFQSASPYA